MRIAGAASLGTRRRAGRGIVDLPTSRLLSPFFLQRIYGKDLMVLSRRLRYPRGVMLWTIFVILLGLWLIGMATAYTVGGLLHLLLVAAIVVLLIRLMQERRPM